MFDSCMTHHRTHMKSKKYNSRKFLNNKHGLAAIEVSCDICDWSMDTNVTISDCNRNVTLDFSIWKEKDYVEKAKKLSLIINELIALQEFMDANVDAYIEARKQLDLKNSTRKSKPLSELLGELND